jgi:hypothetical protein
MSGCLNFFRFIFHRSFFTVFLGAAILNLALFSPCGAFTISGEGDAQAQQGKPAASMRIPPSQAARQSANEGSRVLNILVDRIEGDVIYSRDGQQYPIGSAKVNDNSRNHPAARAKTAELFFQNDSLVSVVLK